MDRSYVTENAAERARLKACVARLSDDEMARPISPTWTVGVALAHLAFVDRLWLAKFEEWERAGVVEMPPGGLFINGINDAMLPWWRTMAPVQVKHDVIAAAEAADSKAESLPGTLVEAILAVRPHTLIRAVHRRAHLDTIERTLAG
jgi:Mycothiol maleylpyruvate isomerase N-terminal domain